MFVGVREIPRKTFEAMTWGEGKRRDETTITGEKGFRYKRREGKKRE